MTYWLNGAWRDERQAIAIDDRGLLLGDGVFETILMCDGAPVFIDRHLDRLRGGMDALGIDATLPDELPALMRRLAEKNALADCDAALRLTVTRGGGARGLAPIAPGEQRPTMLMTIARASAPKSAVSLIVTDRIRHSRGVAARFKTLSYLENILARQDAAKVGADDALMINERGQIVCASAANVFLVDHDGGLVTPPLEDGALPGIVRSVLLEKAADIGVSTAERSVAPDDLHERAFFLTNSLVGLLPAGLHGRSLVENDFLNALNACYREAIADDLREGTPF